MRYFLCGALLLCALSATAAQKQPYLFDVNLAQKPAEVQQMIADYSNGLPDLPVASLAENAHEGPVTLWLFPDAFDLLDRMAATDKSDFVWPRDLDSCKGHAGFFLPQMLISGASAECQNIYAQIQTAVDERTACAPAAEPERYALDYPPGVVDDSNTNTVLDLIGIMGSTFAQFPPLYDGILPDDFVPYLRDVLRKLRYDQLMPPLNGQLGAFLNARKMVDDNAACFIPAKRDTAIERIDILIAESSALRDHIEDLRVTGETEYHKEELRLGAISRARNELPYPSLTQADREFIAFWLGGLYWRLRGGGIIKLDGTQDCRRLGLRRPFTVLGDLAGAAHGKEAADGLYCEIFSGWGEWFDMGTTPGGDDRYYDLVKMTRRGFEQIETAVAGSSALNACAIPDPPFVLDIEGLNQKNYDTTQLIAAGLTMGPCYYFPWDQLFPWVWANEVSEPYGGVIDGPTAIGEVCIGGALAVGLTRTLLNGWATGQPPTCIIDCADRVCGDNNCGGECGQCDEELVCEEATGQCVTPPDDTTPDDDMAIPDELFTDDQPGADDPLSDDELSDQTDQTDLPDDDTADSITDTLVIDDDTVTPKNTGGGCGCSLAH